jgi:multicomponent Na+:H+ antiporter subunit E
VVIFFANLLPRQPARFFEPSRWFWAMVYVPYFLYYCVRANLDVAYRVLHPDMPIRPGIVKVHTTLRSEMGRTFLANSITLTPGTLAVDIDGQDLYIHWINVRGDDAAEHTAQIVKPFEGLLRRVFE